MYNHFGYHQGVTEQTAFYNWYTRANDSKHLNDKQHITNDWINYFSSIIDRISKKIL